MKSGAVMSWVQRSQRFQERGEEVGGSEGWAGGGSLWG